MTLSVMRQIQFNAGHRLLGHEGKCVNLHGHNYTAEIHVTAAQTDALGRVVDFSVINRLFKGWIDEHWDHSVLLWDQDTECIAAVSSITPNRLYCLPYNPTAENMAKYLLLEIAPKLIAQIEGYDIVVNRVVIWETANSAAEAKLDIENRAPISAASSSVQSNAI